MQSTRDYLSEPIRLNTEDVTLQQEIGRGGSSHVHLGLFKKKVVAVKALNWDKNDIEKVREEIYILSHLQTTCMPHIVQFYGYYFVYENHAQNIVLEYVPNGSLDNFIASKEMTFLTALQKYQILFDTITAIAFLHDLQILHRDLKSGNILLDEYYRAKITDFGSATKLANAGGKYAYTVAWTAPEFFIKGPQTFGMDIFSFGVVQWEMVAWKRPFADMDERDKMFILPNRIIKENLREKIPSRCPKKLSGLIQRCWETSPDKRPSAKVVRDGLLDVMNAESKNETSTASTCRMA